MNGEIVVSDDVAGAFASLVVEAFLDRPNDGFALALSGGSTARQCAPGRDAAGVWTPVQARPFMDYTRAIGGRIYAAELFNEPNSRWLRRTTRQNPGPWLEW